MSILEVCAVAIVVVLALILLTLRRLLSIVDYERTLGIGNRLHFAVDGIVSLVGAESVGPGSEGRDRLGEIIDELQMVRADLDDVKRHTEYLVPPRQHQEPPY